MQHNRPTPLRRPQSWRLPGGSCLLLLYLAAATPLAPALTALLAATDRDHHVAIQQTEHGLQVVLRHECSNLPSHQHGMVARVLTLFAQRTTPAQPDHVIQFGATDTVRETSSIATEPESCSVAFDAFPASQAPPRVSRLNRFSAAFPRPPPAANALLLTVRSTVLIV